VLVAAAARIFFIPQTSSKSPEEYYAPSSAELHVRDTQPLLMWRVLGLPHTIACAVGLSPSTGSLHCKQRWGYLAAARSSHTSSPTHTGGADDDAWLFEFYLLCLFSLYAAGMVGFARLAMSLGATITTTTPQAKEETGTGAGARAPPSELSAVTGAVAGVVAGTVSVPAKAEAKDGAPGSSSGGDGYFTMTGALACCLYCVHWFESSRVWYQVGVCVVVT
jgi:hypothetical protein